MGGEYCVALRHVAYYTLGVRYLDEDLCWLFKVHGTMVGALHLASISGQRRRRLHASDV